MAEPEIWFSHGGIFSEVFPTPQGWISIFAEIRVVGSTIYLSEFDYAPLATKRLSIGVTQNLEIRQLLVSKAREEGYTKLVITGVRLTGRNPNRLVRYERSTG